MSEELNTQDPIEAHINSDATVIDGEALDVEIGEPEALDDADLTPSNDAEEIALFERFFALSGADSKVKLLKLSLIVSAALSFVWFYTKLGGLFGSIESAPTLMPLLSATAGVLLMEGAINLWLAGLQRPGGTVQQYYTSIVGFVSATIVSVATTMMALMAFTGAGGVAWLEDVDRLVNGPTIAFYVGLQILCAIFYFGPFDPRVADAIHRARMDAKANDAKRRLEKVTARAHDAGLLTAEADFKELGRIAAKTAKAKIEAELLKSYGVEGQPRQLPAPSDDAQRPS